MEAGKTSGVDRTMEKRTKKKDLNSFSGGVVGCCGKFFVGEEIFGGKDVICWLVD